MFIGFFDFCLELMDGYKIWLVCTVIMCLLLLKFQYSSMLEIHNDDSDYPDEFDDEEPDDEEAGEKQANEDPVVEAQISRETETIVKEEKIVNQATEEFEDSEMENVPVSKHAKISSAGTESAEMPPAVELSGEKEVAVELTPQQQKIDNILTFLSITFCFFVFSGLIMKILLFILGLILTFVGGIFESILGIDE